MCKEKRRLSRAYGQTLGEVGVQIGETIHKANVRNFSVEGMGVVIDHPAGFGKHISIYIANRKKTVKIDAAVKHSTPLGEGKWLVGIRLSRLLGVDDI